MEKSLELLISVIERQKKLSKELIQLKIQHCKNEIKFYKFSKRMNKIGMIYIPPSLSLEELINSCKQEIERLKYYERKIK